MYFYFVHNIKIISFIHIGSDFSMCEVKNLKFYFSVGMQIKSSKKKIRYKKEMK